MIFCFTFGLHQKVRVVLSQDLRDSDHIFNPYLFLEPQLGLAVAQNSLQYGSSYLYSWSDSVLRAGQQTIGEIRALSHDCYDTLAR